MGGRRPCRTAGPLTPASGARATASRCRVAPPVRRPLATKVRNIERREPGSRPDRPHDPGLGGRQIEALARAGPRDVPPRRGW
jgi:hypothetical protein